MAVTIEKEECEGCGTCMSVCPTSAIVLVEVSESIIAEVVAELCDECGECIEYCLRGAIKGV